MTISYYTIFTDMYVFHSFFNENLLFQNTLCSVLVIFGALTISETISTVRELDDNWVMSTGNGSTLGLTRYFNYTQPGIPSALHLAILFKLKLHDFVKWIINFQSWHNNFHCAALG